MLFNFLGAFCVVFKVGSETVFIKLDNEMSVDYIDC